MDPLEIINKYYRPGTRLREIYLSHVIAVTNKAVEIAKRVPELKPDISFIKEAGMLHDIGIFKTHAPSIYCDGDEDYIRHGIIGAEILRKLNLPKHALVAERHTGLGLSKKTIIEQGLNLPHKDFVPESVEEEIICFADKFFSKNPSFKGKELPLNIIENGIRKHDPDGVERFRKCCEKFKEKC
jgi:uncharacterized protein